MSKVDIIDGPKADNRPPLTRDRSFLGLTGALFLGAFNDNLFKQIVLLLFVAIPLRGEVHDFQWIGILAFSIPFVLFSGYAGFISDRNSKRRVIVFCKVAEIVIMLLGVIAFWRYDVRGGELTIALMVALAAILFFMGAQSAFFGPGKYGILPELFRSRDLPLANGIIIMATFVSIILGMALAGILMDAFGERLWIPGLVCVAIAMAGTLTSMFIVPTEPADQSLPFDATALTIPYDIRQLLRRDHPLAMSLLVSCVFWATASIVQPTVNAFGKQQLLVSDTWVSLLAAVISLGIALGAAWCGWISRGQLRWGYLRMGAIGITGCLLLLSLAPHGNNATIYGASAACLTMLGFFTGMFAVPLQVFLQARPPHELKGRMIATQNFLNWVAILLSAGILPIFNGIVEATGWSKSTMFAMTAMLMMPIAIFYCPTSKVEFD